jgi:hypothetical protein
VTIEAGATGQTIAGWEVTPRFWEFDKTGNVYDGSWLTSRDAIVDKLALDAGITRVRIEVRSGVENPVDYWTKFINKTISYTEVKSHFYEKINDNTDPNSANASGYQWASFDYYVNEFVLPLKSKLASRGQTLTISLCYVDFGWTDKKGTLSHADQAQEYAELITQAATRLRDKFGISPNFVEIILEPDNTDRWSGAAIGQALVTTKTRLATAGMSPQFIAPSPSTSTRTAGYLDGIATVAGANAALNVVSYHRYDGTTSADSALATIRSRANALGAQTAMLEYVDANTHDFFRDMEYGGASAWQAYAVATKASSASAASKGSILWRANDGTVGLTPQFRQIGLIQKEVRPGARARRVTLSGSDLGLAFQNSDGSDVIALYSPAGGSFKIQGGAKNVYQATFSDADSATYSTQAISKGTDGSLIITIPAGQVVVLHSTS